MASSIFLFACVGYRKYFSAPCIFVLKSWVNQQALKIPFSIKLFCSAASCTKTIYRLLESATIENSLIALAEVFIFTLSKVGIIVF